MNVFVSFNKRFLKNNNEKKHLSHSSFIGCYNIFQLFYSEKFSIEKGKVGYLNSSTLINELPDIFKNDSIVSNLSEGALGDNYFQDDDEYLIYNKKGNTC